MDELIIKNDAGAVMLLKRYENAIMELENNIKELKALEDGLKSRLYKEMDEKGLLKVETGGLVITMIEATKAETLDTKKLKKECPEIYESYIKLTDRKGYVKIRVKE